MTEQFGLQEGLGQGAAVDGIPSPPAALQILDCAKDALPDRDSHDVARLVQFIGTLSGPRRGVLAVVSDQELGGRPNVPNLDPSPARQHGL